MQKLNIPSVKPGKEGQNKNGCLFTTEKKEYAINREIAEAIQEKYGAQMGACLPTEHRSSDGKN